MTTHHEYRGYVFIISHFAQDPGYTVDFPDFPVIITSASTMTEVFANACEALDLHLKSLQRLGIRVPEPNTAASRSKPI